ncbi:MAG: hypothetical protein WC346_08105 [Methanogenium sp.]|jgi:hypothetical protein
MNIIRINDDPNTFNEKKKVILRLNEFLKRFAECNSIVPKLIRSEVRNFSGAFIHIMLLKLEPVDTSLVWLRFYKNVYIPTVDSLLEHSIFPSETIIKLFNDEWKKMQQQNDDTISTAINSSDTSKSFVW